MRRTICAGYMER